MKTGYVLYNLKAGYENTMADVQRLDEIMGCSLTYMDVAKMQDYAAFLCGLQSEDFLILCGGDGTLNHFVNDTQGIDYACKVFYYPLGTGNDFAADLGYEKGSAPFEITEYLQNLPCVTVQGQSYRFINGVGYGIDGYCCEVGDELKKTPGKKVNYKSIAIKGLLFHYKPTNATVVVDGKTYEFKKVWLAPTMHGKYYGGGMIPAPGQDRKGVEQNLSVMVFHGSGKLKTLMIFPSIFKGEHVKHQEAVQVLTGHEITVTFDRPTALQIDGETILGVTSYTAISAAKVAAETKQPAVAK